MGAAEPLPKKYLSLRRPTMKSQWVNEKKFDVKYGK